MQNLLAKLVALGLIGGGFAATGDLGWIAERGRRVLDASEVAVPSAQAEGQPAAGVESDFALPPAVAQPAPVVQPVPTEQPPMAAPVQATAAAVMKPPAGGPTRLAWSGISAGDRLVVWLSAGSTRCLVLDIVDPATGEALAYEAAAVTSEGRPLTAAGPPRRVVAGLAAGETELAVGGMLRIAPAGIATHGEQGRWLGPITAITPIH